MATLALKGHATRGKEVINLLEMLGANRLGYKDTFVGFYYYIECGAICSSDEYPTYSTIFTLEEFLEKYPYKVGDKVCYKPNLQIDTICISEIISMKWADNSVIYFTSNGHSLYACDLQPYKEEIIEEGTNKAVFEGNAQSCDIMNDIIKEETMEDKGTLEQIDLTKELRKANNIEVILGDYEFVLKDGKTYFVKKKPQYPKTYVECCECLSLGEDSKLYTKGYKASLIQDFQKLIIYRNTYWKIAGEQMGLDKPWEQDYDDKCFIVANTNGNIHTYEYHGTDNVILAFPTAEMRDEFYDNFKELIEHCKELL